MSHDVEEFYRDKPNNATDDEKAIVQKLMYLQSCEHCDDGACDQCIEERFIQELANQRVYYMDQILNLGTELGQLQEKCGMVYRRDEKSGANVPVGDTIFEREEKYLRDISYLRQLVDLQKQLTNNQQDQLNYYKKLMADE